MPQIKDPRKPEVMLWLSTLEGEQRLRAFPSLQKSREWTSLIERASVEFAPSADQRGELARRADRVAENLHQELEAA
jgi:hypothetical protein